MNKFCRILIILSFFLLASCSGIKVNNMSYPISNKTVSSINSQYSIKLPESWFSIQENLGYDILLCSKDYSATISINEIHSNNSKPILNLEQIRDLIILQKNTEGILANAKTNNYFLNNSRVELSKFTFEDKNGIDGITFVTFYNDRYLEFTGYRINNGISSSELELVLTSILKTLK